MKNLAMFAMLAGLILLVCSGCATYLPAGSLYTGAKGAIGAGAAANGGIKKIKYVDYEVENILGVYGVYKTVVYGD